jgi:hypothetical protein
MSPFPALEQPFLINPHDQINTSLGPKATKHSKMTPAQRQKAKASRKLKAQENKNELKRKAEEFSMQKVETERLTKKNKSLTEPFMRENNSMTEEISSLAGARIKRTCGVDGTAGAGIKRTCKRSAAHAESSVC